MKKSNLSHKTHLLRILAILCLLSSYLWVAPSQVRALSASSQDHVLGKEQTYMAGEATADNQIVHSDKLSLSISKGDVPQAPDETNPAAPLQQAPALAVSIISSPWATVDHNDTPGSPTGGLPGVFVVEAVVTNTGSVTATNLEVTLDYNEDPVHNWVLLEGEDEMRTVDALAPGASYYAYWFARYPNSKGDIGTIYGSHQYTVTAGADGISPVSTSDNYYGNPPSGKTVQLRATQSTGNSALTQTTAEIIVGVAFTITQVYTTGVGVQTAAFSPVGNDDFDPSAYRLVASKVRFFEDPPGTQEMIVTDHLYITGVPSWVRRAEVIFTFIALLPSNTTLCSYIAFNYGSVVKYDQNYCNDNTKIPITGTLTLSQTKQVSSSTVEQGQLLTYTINYTNTGSRPLLYTWIWDDIPAALASIETDSITPTPAVTTESRVAWDLGTISAAGQDGSTGTLTFAVRVDGDGQDLADNTSLVNHAFFGINPGSLPQKAALTSTVTTTVQAPMIALSKTDGQDTAEPGDALVYTLHITNTGSVATSGLVITDELPTGVTVGTTSPSFDHQDGQTLVWDDQNVPAEDVLVVTIPVTVNSDVPDGTTLTNEATVMYKNASEQHTFATKTATDTTVVQAPVLTITKTAEDVDGGDLVVGDEILYTLQVSNTGNYTAYYVTVTDDLPDQVTCQEVSFGSCDDPLVWEISSLVPATTASLYITVTINEGSEWQSITNTGSVTSSNVFDPPDDPPPVCPDGSEPDPVSGECKTTPEPLDTELALTKTAEDVNGGYLVIGDEVLYTLQVTNTGTYTAYNVTVTDDLPDQVTCQAVSGDSAPDDCNDPLVWSIPSLAVDTTASLYITVTINEGSEGQSITNTGSVTGTNVPDPPDDPDPVCPDGSPPDPVSGECPVTPVQSADLAVSKGVDDAAPDEGDTIVYTISVTNNGPHSTTGVVISDTLPGGVTYVTSTATQGSYNDGTGLWTVGTLHDSDVVTLTITATVDEGTAGQTITNVAEVSASGQLDSDSDNNSDSVNIRSGGGGIIYLPIILKRF